MDQRPWIERLFDRDNSAAPVVVLILLVLVIGFVCTIGPILDRVIEGKSPESHRWAPVESVLHVVGGAQTAGQEAAGYRMGTIVG